MTMAYTWTPQRRKAQSERIKRYWAKRREQTAVENNITALASAYEVAVRDAEQARKKLLAAVTAR